MHGSTHIGFGSQGSGEAPPTFRMDRRSNTRHIVGGSLTLIRHEHRRIPGPAGRSPFASLRLSNMSGTGVAGVSEWPLNPGERVSIHVPSHGGEGGAEMHGAVVRCVEQPSNQGGGFAVAIRLDPVAAAA